MTLLRSLIVGVLAVAAAQRVRTLLADRRRPVRQIAWILLLAPYLTPVLLTGYAYANLSPWYCLPPRVYDARASRVP